MVVWRLPSIRSCTNSKLLCGVLHCCVVLRHSNPRFAPASLAILT